MDRARRAEPYSSATIWTREIARNLAGHLDRLSKVHSCVDTASPKTAHLPQFKHGHHTLKRAGQVSPLKLHGGNAHAAEDGEPHADHEMTHAEESGEERDDRRESMTERGQPGDASPTSTARIKSKKKAKSGSRRPQAEVNRLEALAVENQRLQERIASMTSTAADPHDVSGAYDAQPVPSHTKKSATQDYHKRHKQQQIWQENQALAKRLKNAKPTLSSKDWEKDDKWNQQFLKTQERRRQALHNEMSRTLASPHSALIRVKHVSGTNGSVHGRPATDIVGGDEISDPTATVIEVTTADAVNANSKSRGVRRRRSSNEDSGSTSGDSRRYSTAANHRRIMELRKQRDHATEHRRESSEDAVQGEGPTDELVSVRFTFSRQGSRIRSLGGGLCTPNGITGQFSPAIELERALEAGSLSEEELLPVPVLEPLISSRLAEDDDTEINSTVFETLQDCIDKVATIEDARQSAVARDDVRLHTAALDDLRNETVSPQETNMQSCPEADLADIQPHEDTQADAGVEPLAEPPVVAALAVTEADWNVEVPDEQRETVAEQTAVADAESVENLEPEMLPSDPSGREMDASGYGSEFDVDEDPRTTGDDVPPPPAMPLIPDAPEDDGDDDYEDDHTEEETHSEEPAIPPPPTASSHPEEDAEEAQYDDDLEPDEGGEEDPAELSYSDDGFTGDD